MKKLIGLFASVALLSSGVAFANGEGKKHDQQTQSQSSTGGSGQTGMTGQLSGNQLTGRVVKSEKKMIWVEHAGAVVPLKIDKNTQFTDPNLKKIQDLKAGDEIRASFEVKQTDNVATSIQKADAATGGSGQGVMEPDPTINDAPNTLPPSMDDGTGGAGIDKDSDLGTDADKNKQGDY